MLWKQKLSQSNPKYKIYKKLLKPWTNEEIAHTIVKTSSITVCFICKAIPSEIRNVERLQNKET